MNRILRQLAAMCVFGTVTALAQEEEWPTITPFELGYAMRHWTADDGLNNNRANVFDQSKDGYLWIGTDAGLSRINLDDYTIQTYTVIDGLKNDFIASVICNNENQIWVSTNDGIAGTKIDEINFAVREKLQVLYQLAPLSPI